MAALSRGLCNPCDATRRDLQKQAAYRHESESAKDVGQLYADAEARWAGAWMIDELWTNRDTRVLFEALDNAVGWYAEIVGERHAGVAALQRLGETLRAIEEGIGDDPESVEHKGDSHSPYGRPSRFTLRMDAFGRIYPLITPSDGELSDGEPEIFFEANR